MIVNTIKDWFEHGQYQVILDRLAQQDIHAQVAALSEPDQIELRYYQSCALLALGHVEQGLQVATTTHTTLQATGMKNPLLLASLSAQVRALDSGSGLGEIDTAWQLLTEGDALLQSLTVQNQATALGWIPVFEQTRGIFLRFRKGNNIGLALDSLSRALTGFKKLNHPSHLAETLWAIGTIFYYKMEYDTALEYLQRSLALYKKLDHKAGIASVLLYMGFLSIAKGETNTMTEYFNQSLTFAEVSGVPVLVSDASRYVGLTHFLKGEFDTALGYYQRALALAETIGYKFGILDTTERIGWLYYTKGELDKAFDYIQRSKTLAISLKDDNMLARVLCSLIQLTLNRQDRVQAQAFLTDLQNIAAQNPDRKHIKFGCRLMEALISKESPRMVDKVHAQTLLRQLVTEEHFGWLRNLAMRGLLYLCDLLIYEARATGENEAWEEAKMFLDQFNTRVQDTKFAEFRPEALLLQAKFALIEGDLQQAQTSLNEAKTVATELNRGLLVARVEAEQKQLATDFEKWQDMILRNAPLQERLAAARLEEYLHKAQDALARPP